MKNLFVSNNNLMDGTLTSRVLSRISSMHIGNRLDSILSRFSLVSLILMTIGGFTVNAWGATAKLALCGNSKSTQSVTKSDGVVFTHEGTYSVGGIFADYNYTGSGKETSFSWTAPTGYSVSVSQMKIDARMYSGSNGYAQYKTSANNTYNSSSFCNSTSWGNTKTLNAASYFPISGKNGSVTIKAFNRELNYKNAEITYTLTANPHSITLDNESPTVSGSTSVTLTYDSNTHDDITNPTKDNYTFDGWWTGDNGTGSLVIAVDGTMQANVSGYTGANGVWKKDATTTLYAKWILNSKTVTLDNQSATTAGTASITVFYNKSDNLTATPAITVPAKTGYTFEGYYTAKNGGGLQLINKNGNVNASVSGYTDANKKWIYDGNVTLYAYWKQNQSITWDQTIGNKIRSKTVTLSATASSNLTVTYTATSNAGTVSISGNTLTCLTAGSVTVTAHQAGNGSWNAATDVSKTFTIVEHAITQNPTATSITYEQALSNSTLSGGTANVDGSWSWKYPTSVPNAGTANQVAVFTPSSSIISAYPLECEVSVTVAKATPDITCNIANSYEVDDATLDLQSLWTREGDGTITYSKLSFTPTGSNNEDATAPAIANNRYLSLGQAGNLRIQMDIQAGTNYVARTVTKDITINKRANALSCSWNSWSKDMNVDSETGVTISANNTQTPIVIEQTSGDDEGNVIATYANNKITSIYNIGTATWSVSQAENYKYVAAETKTLTVNVVKGSTECNFYEDASQHEIGDWGDEWEAVTWADNFVKEVSFQAAKNMGTAVGDLEVYIMINGNWQKYKSIAVGDLSGALGSYDFGSNYFTYSIASNVRGIKFKNTGSYSRAIKNLSLKRKASMTLSTAEIIMPTNTLGGNHTTAKFTVDYSTCADQIKVVSNHPHITVSPASFASEGNGTKEITVTYACDDPESIDGVITVYTPYENKTINVHADTEKKSQEIEWSDLFAGETVSLPQTFTSNDAASATSKLPVTYISGNSDIIEVAEDGLSFTIVGTGTTTLTATQAGNDLWKSTSDTKTINASNKKIQRIKWNQQFTRSLAPGQEIPLTATVTVLNIATGIETESVERSTEIVYTCPTDNGVIEILNETNIRVLGYGNTTITASVAGNEEYEAAASVTLPVRVREMQTGDCDMPLVLEQNDEIEFFQGNTQQIIGSAIAINHANGIPDKLNFDVRGAAWTLGIEYYKGGIIAQQSTDNKISWSDLTASAISPDKGGTVSSGEIQLNPNATHIRFVRPSGGQGYHYVGNIHITRLPYLRTENTTIDLGNISVGEKRDFTIPVSYCSVKGNMSVTKKYSDNGLTTEEAIEAECGDMSSHDLQASILPSVVGPWTNTVTVRDPLSNMTLDVTINATIQKGDQVITWNPALDILATEAPLLNAVASSGLAVSYEVTSGNNTVARIDNGQVVILQPGTFAITASQGGNANYNAAPNVVKEFTVTAETLTLIEAPTASDLTYGQTLSASTLTGGSVEDSKHNPVAGTFSWQAGNTMPNAGNAQEFTVVFTPSSNAVWYNTLQTTAEVNVAKATPTLSWQNAPEDLAYDATNVVYTATSTSNEGAITYSITNGGDYASIDSESGELTIIVPGHEITIQASQEESQNYNAPDMITVTVTIEAAPVAEPNVFTNADGDNDWNNPNNWTSVPTGENPDIIVSGELVIDEEVTVGSITIQSTGGVIVVSDGVLTVTGVSDNISSYGDLHVKNDGEVILTNTASMTVNNFILDAALAGLKNIDDPTSNQAAMSGQVRNAASIDQRGNAYFDLSFDPSGKISYGWYDFTVPFEVNINGGIARINSADDKVMVSGTDFIIMEDDEQNRANGGKGWRRMNSGVLRPGKLYTITLDDEVDQNTLRFTWNGANSLANGTSYQTVFATGSNPSLNGWNGLGNGMLCHGYMNGTYKTQAYNHKENTYDLVAGAKTFAVGSAFFIQVEAADNVNWIAAEAIEDRPLFAPQREAEEVEEFLLGLRQENVEKNIDVLYFSASEEATEEYVIGHDLLKMGTMTDSKKARMWATKGGKNLCDVEATLINNDARCELGLYAPKAGEYTLLIEEAPEEATLYLTYNNRVIWNLSASAYTFDLEQGSTDGYGLRLVAEAPQMQTGIDETGADAQGVKKVLIDNVIYLVTPQGAMYDINGKIIK